MGMSTSYHRCRKRVRAHSFHRVGVALVTETAPPLPEGGPIHAEPKQQLVFYGLSLKHLLMLSFRLQTLLLLVNAETAVLRAL